MSPKIVVDLSDLFEYPCIRTPLLGKGVNDEQVRETGGDRDYRVP